MYYEAVAQFEGFAFIDSDGAGGGDAGIDHPDVTRIVPCGSGVIGMIYGGDADGLAVFELYRVVVPAFGGPV